MPAPRYPAPVDNPTPPAVDLAAYLQRIGWAGPYAPDRETLKRLASLHTAAIPFENLNPLLRMPVPLDLVSLQAKLVAARRGGYCFEHNTLFAGVLRDMGFAVTTLAARVLWGRPEDAITPRSHMLLRVDLPEGPFIADVGFGGLTLTGALELKADVPQPTPHERFRLVEHEGVWRMQALVRGEWSSLYRFDLELQHAIDYEVANWYVAANPASHFVHHLMAARALPGRRLALMDRDFAVHALHGDTERRTLQSPDEIAEVLEREFGIAMSDASILRERLELFFT
ncbi:arylamine N-acetyltransferase [Piscinibacter sp. XHJ-5]|uniref:arylamine N-acetyltransferase family protein n=1 Tax=Piscinibacter sp. XHJ-5 TaxID=3037797 RepID=UPI00245304DD|nr:arylamine N-acetyltransferase [Piscinibacter sp. XHJ-5]